LLAILLAIGPSWAAGAKQTKARIGVITSRSGAVAPSSLPMIRALQLTVERINQQGGVALGHNKMLLELVFVDAKSDPQRAVTLLKELAKDPTIVAVIGPNHSPMVTLLQDQMDSLDLPLINASAAAIRQDKVPEQTRVFSIGMMAERYFELVMNAALHNQRTGHPARVGIIYENDTFGIAVLNGVVRHSEQVGLPLVFQHAIASVRDLHSAHQLLQQRQPTVLIVAANKPSLSRDVLRMIARDKVDLDMLVFSACDVAQLSSLGSIAEYVLCPVQWDGLAEQQDPYWGKAATFFSTYEVTFGAEPPYQAAQAAAALTVIAKGLEKAAVLDRAKLRAALEETDLNTVFGPVRFGPNGRNSSATALLEQIRGGTTMTVLPPERAWIPLIATMPAWKDRLP
jgi:branched-chain amino acid transport system substrate-binding protein